MKMNKNLAIWICFLGSNLLALIGFAIINMNKMTGNFILISSLFFLAGFLFVAIKEIVTSLRLSKSEKIIWPILIIVLSTFGQIAYLSIRKRGNLKSTN
jgi:hypothetical protein